MRAPKELIHRFRQELVNLELLVAPPAFTSTPPASRERRLPDPEHVAEKLRHTRIASEIEQLAGDILQHRFPIFCAHVSTGEQIKWRRDYIRDKETDLRYFRRIRYLDTNRSGDHKWIWELNRHQHFVLLSQAFLLFQSPDYLEELARELESWLAQNPFQRGINWASALEVAFRAMSWVWVLHLVGHHLHERIRRKFEEQLYLHGLHLENNLSYYFAPNTHLLGEAVALNAIARMLVHLPRAPEWAALGSSVVEHQMERQVDDDGVHFERSTYYHLYALDMFLFYAVLNEAPQLYRLKLAKMADYLAALLGSERRIPFIGDDDGGRWFHPYGNRKLFGCATLAACNAYFSSDRWPALDEDYWPIASWWMNCEPHLFRQSPLPSLLFNRSGVVVLNDLTSKAIVQAGPFPSGSAGHSHADALSLTLWKNGEEVLIDPGTFTYTGDTKTREVFRGPAAHNTIKIEGLSQADPAGPFRWTFLPFVRLVRWQTDESVDLLTAESSYRGVVHRRHIRFIKSIAILIVDQIDGPPGPRTIHQFWHFATEGHLRELVTEHPFVVLPGLRSRCFGRQEHAVTAGVSLSGELPALLCAGIALRNGVQLSINGGDTGPLFRIQTELKTISISSAEFLALR
jgi:Heparinase II/III-like protein/Heparinase II/III N-terminus